MILINPNLTAEAGRRLEMDEVRKCIYDTTIIKQYVSALQKEIYI